MGKWRVVNKTDDDAQTRTKRWTRSYHGAFIVLACLSIVAIWTNSRKMTTEEYVEQMGGEAEALAAVNAFKPGKNK